MQEKKYRRIIVPRFTIEQVDSVNVDFLCRGDHVPIQGVGGY